MPTARRSRYLRSGQQTDILEQLAKILRRLIGRAPRQRRVRGHYENSYGTHAAHRAVYEQREESWSSCLAGEAGDKLLALGGRCLRAIRIDLAWMADLRPNSGAELRQLLS